MRYLRGGFAIVPLGQDFEMVLRNAARSEKRQSSNDRSCSPTLENVENDIFESIYRECLFRSHDSPEIKDMSSRNLEGGRLSQCPTIVARAHLPRRRTRYEVRDAEACTRYHCQVLKEDS